MWLSLAGFNQFASFKDGLISVKPVHQWSLRLTTGKELSHTALILQLAVTSFDTQKDTLALLK
jgi:hypothetical protein